MPTFKDYFSEKAKNYAQYRPHYPLSLFHYLASLTTEHQLAWDCGTGNGQAAVALANYYQQVIASDASAEQIAQAELKDNIEYRVMPAEKTDLEGESIDLITVAMALHWFNFKTFFTEVKRVLKPQGVLAAWCYSLPVVTTEIDQIIKEHLYKNILGTYWPPERRYIEEHFQTIPFPFPLLTPPSLILENHWDLQALLNYLGTWSAALLYQKQNSQSAIEVVMPELIQAWGDPNRVRKATHELYLLVGRKNNE